MDIWVLYSYVPYEGTEHYGYWTNKPTFDDIRSVHDGLDSHQINSLLENGNDNWNYYLETIQVICNTGE